MRLTFQRARSAGYTLIEIMLVLSIIVVLMGLGVFLLRGNLEFAKETRVQADFQALSTQLRTYETYNLRMPTTAQGLKALVEKPSTPPVPQRWKPLLEKELRDPWDMPYNYRNPGKWNPKGFDLWSFGPDRVESDDDVRYEPGA